MAESNKHFRCGFTLIELMITILAAVILLIGITGILAAGHKNFQTMFRRTSQGVVPDAYAARRAFDLIVRKSSIKRLDPSDVYDPLGSNEIYVYYYSDPSNPDPSYPGTIFEGSIPDKYAHFYRIGTQFMLDTGSVDRENFGGEEPPTLPRESTLILTNSINSVSVNPVRFTESNHAIQMVLILDSETGSSDPLGTLQMTVTSTAIQHN